MVKDKKPPVLDKLIEEYKIAITVATRRVVDAESEMVNAKASLTRLEGGLQALLRLREEKDGG